MFPRYEVGFDNGIGGTYAAAARDDGTLLVLRLGLMRIELDGTVAALGRSSSWIHSGTSFGLSRRGNAFSVFEFPQLSVFDADGKLTGQWSGPPNIQVGTIRFSQSGTLLADCVVPYAGSIASPLPLEVHMLDGSLAASFDSGGTNVRIPVAGDLVFRGLRNTLTAQRFDGSQLWSVDVGGGSIFDYETSDDGRHLILAVYDALQDRRIVHVADSVPSSPILLSFSPNRVVMSSEGVWSATRSYEGGHFALFREGSVVANLTLDIDASSIESLVDVNDRGQMLVSGRMATGMGKVELIPSTGVADISCTSAESNSLFPDAFFAAQGRYAALLFSDGLYLLDVP